MDNFGMILLKTFPNRERISSLWRGRKSFFLTIVHKMRPAGKPGRSPVRSRWVNPQKPDTSSPRPSVLKSAGFRTGKSAGPEHGAVAQLGERRVRNAKVEGSIPFRSTNPAMAG